MLKTFGFRVLVHLGSDIMLNTLVLVSLEKTSTLTGLGLIHLETDISLARFGSSSIQKRPQLYKV